MILRTSWVYGAYGKNFLKTILRLASERESLRIVADQYGAPTSDESIADAVLSLLKAWDVENLNQTGIYHLTNQGKTSWHGFSAAIVSEYQQLEKAKNWPSLKTTVENIMPITTADYPTPAARPANSNLYYHQLKQMFNVELPTWQQALKRVMQTITL